MRGALLSLLRERPLDEITGAVIAEQAGIGYSTFFRHYADVRALLIDTVGTITDELAQAMMPALLAGDGPAAARTLLAAVAERRLDFGALLAGAGDALRVELARQVVGRLEALPDLSPDWLPRHLGVRVAVAATVELLDWWLTEEPQRSPEAVADLLNALVLLPLSAGA
ncbi:TetR/AcrR family transcriptional regulator [Novosphingobium soli]